MPLLNWESMLMRTSSLRTLPLPDAPAAPPQQQQAIVSLAQVRCGPRASNEYVDSPRPLPVLPLKPAHIGLSSALLSSPAPTVPGSGHAVSLPCRGHQHTTPGSGGGVSAGGNGTRLANAGDVVTATQLSKCPSLKEEAGGAVGAGDEHSSIICSNCGKCRCGACSEPRELPAQWCCGDRYEVSAQKAVDVCTCFCCVQTAFYHCGAEEDNTCYDKPCACGGSKCCSRWICLAASALCLPCLWCYWPLKGCVAATTACYNCCRRKGCQCSRRPADKTLSNCSQTRRLLIESDSSTSSA